ncbi:hypothetical protein [Frigidibacter sp. SD6-1]|uniref:hypothetical protein n=1 Tax=Frigidibacter sp. SD6-1 TaxID=3032581 RepID=UPI0024DFF21E|nr:hypothetical protein [Frigidibacter sp. SD6-1]
MRPLGTKFSPTAGPVGYGRRCLGQCLILLLVLTLTLAGLPHAGSAADATAFELCADGGSRTVWLDASGAPAQPMQDCQKCPKCLFAGQGAILAAPVLIARRDARRRPGWRLASWTAPAMSARRARARGPPSPPSDLSASGFATGRAGFAPPSPSGRLSKGAPR